MTPPPHTPPADWVEAQRRRLESAGHRVDCRRTPGMDVSAMLFAVARPELERYVHDDDEIYARAVLAVACLAWNAAVTERVAGGTFDRHMLEGLRQAGFDPALEAGTLQAGRIFAARKDELYPDVLRIITACQYRQTDGNRYLDIGSTLVG